MTTKDNLGIPITKREIVRRTKQQMNSVTPSNDINLDVIQFITDCYQQVLQDCLAQGYSIQTKLGLFKILLRESKPHFDYQSKSIKECHPRLYLYLKVNDTVKRSLRNAHSIQETQAYQNQKELN